MTVNISDVRDATRADAPIDQQYRRLKTVDRLLAHMLATHARTHALALSYVLTVETTWL